MFTAITGSTRMYETLGDTKAYNIVRDHFEIFFESIEKVGGKVIRPLAKIARTGKMPIPQEKITFVGWASCPSNKFMKRTFARGLLKPSAMPSWLPLSATNKQLWRQSVL